MARWDSAHENRLVSASIEIPNTGGQPFEKNGTEGGHFCGFTMDVEEKSGWIDGNGMGRKDVAVKE